MGGWLAATLIIGIMWYMNHYHGAILNPPGKIWLDQAGVSALPELLGELSAFKAISPTSFMQYLP